MVQLSQIKDNTIKHHKKGLCLCARTNTVAQRMRSSYIVPPDKRKTYFENWKNEVAVFECCHTLEVSLSHGVGLPRFDLDLGFQKPSRLVQRHDHDMPFFK